MTFRRLRRVLVFALLMAAAWYVGRPALHLARTAWNDRPTLLPTPPGHADDASRLNATPVREVWKVPEHAGEAERQLIGLLRRARSEGLPVAIAGARHSMGGHTIAPGGLVVDMLPFRALSLSADGQVLTVQAGALWRDILPFLDERGRSVAVMQSDNGFSVGGSLSANVHGWQSKRPPIASSVRSFRLLTADGAVLRCSRTEHPDLFSLVLGGYGLFGIILDAELWTVPNEWYRAERYVFPAAAYAAVFRERVERDSAVVMAYGRVSVAPGTFLDEAVLTVFRRVARPGNPPLPALGPPSADAVERAVFRGSVGSPYGKTLRWSLERRFGGYGGGTYVTRNQLLNGVVDLYANRSEERTEVLHEYFLPPGRLAAFLERARHLVPHHGADLLNVTVRDVRRDPDTFLRYANEDVLAVVMLFNQARSPRADSSMAALTRALIDAASALGGTYYLPYRPHATLEQFTRAYPQAAPFFERKRRLDPALLFQNGFFLRYGQPLLPPAGAPAPLSPGAPGAPPGT